MMNFNLLLTLAPPAAPLPVIRIAICSLKHSLVIVVFVAHLEALIELKLFYNLINFPCGLLNIHSVSLLRK